MRSGIWTWLAAIPVTVAVGALYTWKGGESLLFVLLLLLLIMLQGAATQLLGPKRVEAKRSWHPLTPRAGDTVAVTLDITVSGGLLPLWVEVEDEWSVPHDTGQAADAGSRGGKLVFGSWKRRFTGTYYLKDLDRGVYTGDDMRITWGDSFGWFKRGLRMKVRDELVVHPVPLPLGSGGAGTAGPDVEGLDLGRDSVQGYAEAGRLRAYMPGDPLRRVHWKSSAKQGALLTRIPEDREMPARRLYLDTAAASYDRPGAKRPGGPAPGAPGSADAAFELAVSAAAAWLARELGADGRAEADFRHGGMTGPVSGEACALTGMRGLKAGLDLLAGVTPGPAESGDGLLRKAAAVTEGGALTFITGRLTPELAAAALLLAERGVRLEIWCACGPKGDAESARLAAGLTDRGLSVVDLTRYSTAGAASGEGGVRHDIA
ncbi:DUF58 domain-containing protein [Paenibacillus sp. M1]|uniref:DUF58 domain-containing protein n=1 Tax=Paenibacillus haidiansis TaxID=1574488 RepID=A0ABU7VQT1_9BACL